MKKRIISIVLLLAILFALSACTGTPSSTDNGSGETDTGTTDTGSTNTGSTDSGTSGGNTHVPSILDYDANKYEAKFADKNQTKLKYAAWSVKAPTFTDYYNNYSAALSMTFDDGASISAARVANEIMSEYGLKGTLLVNIDNIEGNVHEWQELVSKGTLDIGSHSWNHIDPKAVTQEEMEHQIKDSYDYLQQHFPNENPVTYATPLSTWTNEYLQYLKNTGFIANRLETGGQMISPSTENPDLMKLYAKRIDTGNNAETNVRINVSDALGAGKWFIELFHSVRTQDPTDIPEEEFKNHCKWLYDNYNGKVWFASYDDVAKYMVQRQNATIEYTACDRESMTFVATLDEDYGQEMTLKFYLPFFVESAYAIINGEEQYLTLQKESSNRFVCVNAEISEEGTEIKIVMGGNKYYQNNCNHEYIENNVVAPTSTTYGYTEMICTNEKCNHTYKAQYTNKIEN